MHPLPRVIASFWCSFQPKEATISFGKVTYTVPLPLLLSFLMFCSFIIDSRYPSREYSREISRYLIHSFYQKSFSKGRSVWNNKVNAIVICVCAVNSSYALVWRRIWGRLCFKILRSTKTQLV